MNLELKKSLFINNINKLTARQIEYLALAALGLSNIEIANILFVTQSTVKKTFEIIFEKLKARDRAHAVTISFIHKILDAEVLNYISERYNISKLKIEL